MARDIGNILNAAQAARLAAMKRTANQIDGANLRLSSGLKVNSAIDNPASYFIAKSLRNRASDLAALLDGIGQNIRAVQMANTGIDADLKILDLAESYLQDIEKKYMAGEITLTPGVPTNETHVTFAGPGDLIQYVSGQDMPASGTITTPSSDEVTLSGNFWKRKAFNYNVTSQTVMEFDYFSSLIQEVSTIGFDSDTNYTNDANRFWIYGTQTSGITYAAPTATYDYSGSGTWEHIVIPVGTYFTGNFTHLTFVNDDDALPYGNASFRDIVLREGPVQYSDVADPAIAKGYAEIVNQIDLIAKDANYRGTNLLKRDAMTTYFNEDRSSKLVTEGIDATFAGLGLKDGDFNSLEGVQTQIAKVRAARNTLRNYASTLSTHLNIIRIRQDFTNAQINVLKEGADDLTNADANEEGANLIALQTRQQIQVSMFALRSANIFSILS